VADVDSLLDEFAASRARGERPDARVYLARAGAAADELRELLDELLVAAPPPAPDEEAVALMAAWAAGKSPLFELRRRRGRRVDAVVDDIMGALGLDPPSRVRVTGHYRRLEGGQLDLRRVDRRVLDAIGGAIGAGSRDLGAWGIRRGTPAPPATGAPDDEVDRLFGLD
jgi:hypothetical protein